MSAFSKSEFAALLDELIAAHADDEAPPPPPSMPFGFVGADDAVERLWANVPGAVAAELYNQSATGGAYRVRDTPGIETPEPEQPPPSIDPAEIARELSVAAARHPRDLDRIRREFAFANHPDRVVPALRERAETRMRIANMLIDQVKRKLAVQKS